MVSSEHPFGANVFFFSRGFFPVSRSPGSAISPYSSRDRYANDVPFHAE